MLAKTFSLLPAIGNAYYNKWKNNIRTYDVFHPSSFGGCLRKVAYQYYDVDVGDSAFDEKGQRIFDCGHYMHFRYKDIFKEAHELWGYWKCKNPLCNLIQGDNEKRGIPFSKVVTCKCGNNTGINGFEYEEVLAEDKEYNFSGHVDAIVRAGDGYEPDDFIIVDFKTINSNGFNLLTSPKHVHCVQVAIYMHILNISHSVLFYEDKDKQLIKEFRVDYDKKVAENIMETAKKLLEILKSNKIPPRPYQNKENSYDCKYCEYSKICWKSSKLNSST